MSPSTARHTKPAPILGLVFSLLASFAALMNPGCDSPESQLIARFPADTAAGAGGALEAAGGSGGGGSTNTEAGAAGMATEPPRIPAQRGRVKIVDGKLVTDLGTPLRGMLLPVDTDWPLADFDFLHALAQTTGLNAVHIYLENSELDVGVNHYAADALVALAAEQGLYVVIGYGTGMKLGAFDPVKLKAFWTFYAGRYAARTNVVYEIQNDPEKVCQNSPTTPTLTMEQQMYTLIRSKAPDTHVLMFSTTSIVYPSVLTAAVKGVGAAVDWSNASFAVGGTNTCLPQADISTLTAAAKAAGVALISSQLPSLDKWQPYIPFLEAEGVGWLQYRWFGIQDETLQTFIDAVTKAKLTWCPERGTFPEDSAACR
jgi:Cellulase (glycosyl hydrolase family 5)